MSRPRIATAVAAALALTLAMAAPASGDTPFDIDLTGDTAVDIQPFGYPAMATYGQVITVPEGVDGITTFSFVVDLPAALVFRGAIHAWDGEKATGPELYLSGPRSTAGNGTEVVTFTPNITVEPGQYVIYATVSHDYPTNAAIGETVTGAWWASSGDSYDGGPYGYLNSGGNVEALTTTAWTTWSGIHLAFAVAFFIAPDQPPDPANPDGPATPAAPVVADPTFTG